MKQLTEQQQNCDALREAYESTWDVETKIDDLKLNEHKHKEIIYHIQQIAGILAKEMEAYKCHILN